MMWSGSSASLRRTPAGVGRRPPRLAESAVDDTDEMAALAGRLLSCYLQYAGSDPLRLLDRAEAVRRSDAALTADEAA